MGYLRRTLRNLSLKPRKTYGYKAVDQVRDTLLKTDYECFLDSELTERRRCLMSAVRSNEIEDSYRIPEQVALDEMILDMRVPSGAIRRYASQIWIDLAMQPDSDVSRRFAYERRFQHETQTSTSH